MLIKKALGFKYPVEKSVKKADTMSLSIRVNQRCKHKLVMQRIGQEQKLIQLIDF
jgi:hypothetical protein